MNKTDYYKTDKTSVSETIQKPPLVKAQTTFKKNKTWQMQCGTIMTLISPGGSTLQCGRWLWDDMPLNSQKRTSSAILEFYNYLVSTSTISPRSTCHSAPVCEILSKSDHPQQKKMISIFKMADLSRLGF